MDTTGQSHKIITKVTFYWTSSIFLWEEAQSEAWKANQMVQEELNLQILKEKIES